MVLCTCASLARAEVPAVTSPYGPSASLSPEQRLATLQRLDAQMAELKEQRPSVLPPLVLMIVGANLAAGAVTLGFVDGISECSDLSSDSNCDGSIPAGYLVFGAIAFIGGVGGGGIWLLNNMSERREVNVEIKKLQRVIEYYEAPNVTLTPVVTQNSAQARLTFTF